MGPVGSEKNRIYFCPNSPECHGKYFREKDQQKGNNSNNNSPWGKKCAGCDNIIDSEWIGDDGKGSWYCSVECANKNHKTKSEIEKAQDKLENLKSKLEESSDPNEKKNLEKEIKSAEDQLKDLGNKDKPKNNPSQSDQPKANYGKLFLAGAVIFSVAILVLILIIRKRKKNIKK